jgi:hypothetical protein
LVDSIVAALGIYAGTLVVGVLSGLVPVINGELFLIGVVLITGQLWPAIVLALLVAVGQMIAKVILFKGVERASEAGKQSRFGAKLAKGDHADKSLNYFGVDASQPLAEWKRKGWIHPDDPRGWFQWYCRY